MLSVLPKAASISNQVYDRRAKTNRNKKGHAVRHFMHKIYMIHYFLKKFPNHRVHTGDKKPQQTTTTPDMTLRHVVGKTEVGGEC